MGYGDIPATTTIEQALCIVVMLMGVVFFSITIGSLTTLLSDFDVKTSLFEKKQEILNEIRKDYKISYRVYNTLSRVLLYDIYRSESNSYKKFMKELPDNIRTELGYFIYNNDVKNIGLFQNHLKKQEFIAKLGPHLQKLIYTKGEYIF